jgi:hypothetical protein
MAPSRYCFSTSITSFWALVISFSFSSGIRRSSMPMEIPARVA